MSIAVFAGTHDPLALGQPRAARGTTASLHALDGGAR